MWILVCLAILGMSLFMLFRRKIYDISLPKIIVVFLFLVLFGVTSTYLMYYIENGEWEGTSLFGAVLFPPLLFVPISLIIRIRYTKLMDFISPASLVMIGIMKANCILEGCCQGMPLWKTAGGEFVYFPSPLIESLATFAIIILLLRWENRKKHQDLFYPFVLILYGLIRFCLNWFRGIPKITETILPMGNIWSLVAIIVGLVWLLVVNYIKINNEYKLMLKKQKEE